jgi:CubicO group peptidase (beta-lactamase class C family)
MPDSTHLPIADPAVIGLDPRRLHVACRLLDKWTSGSDPLIPGGALLVGRHGQIAPPHFSGRQGPEPDAGPLRPDAIFLVASITKPVTYLGAMLLAERGLLSLTEHVTRHIPEFAAHHKEDTLLGHLFTHTSGLPDMLPNNVELRRAHAPLADFVRGAIRDTVPLFRPGTSLSYQSMGTLVMAEIVRRVSDLSIQEFLAREIFQPLGLQSTSLGAGSLDRERIVRVRTPEYQADGNFGWNSRYWRDLGAPWGGMFSTPHDLAVICQLMLQQGSHRGREICAGKTVTAMTGNRLDDYPELPESIRRTQPWGLGWQRNHAGTERSWSDLLDRHVYGHTGATGTMLWIDPVSSTFCVLLTSEPMATSRWRLVRLSNVIAAAIR